MFKKTAFILTILYIFVLFIPMTTNVFAEGFLVEPYIRDVTDNQVTVLWETQESTSGTLYYGTSRDKYEFSINVASGTMQSVIIENLKPGTLYYYRVETGRASTTAGDPNYYFRTSRGGTEPFTFAVYADTSSGKNGFDLDHGRVIRSVIDNSHPDFVIVPGDMVTTGKNEDDWVRFLQVEKDLIRNVPIYAAIGNNDLSGRASFNKYFLNPRKTSWYSFDYSGTHFIALDILRGKGDDYYNSFRPGNPQFSWLLEDLKSENNTNAKFTIVYFHAPVFPADGSGNEILEQMLTPLFEKYGVDMVFNGTHSYTRAEKNGIPYIISGGGGSELIPGKKVNRPEIKEVSYILHHLRVSVNYPAINVDVIDANGNVFSSFGYRDKDAKDGDTRPNVNTSVGIEDIKTAPVSKSEIPLTIFSLPGCSYCENLKSKVIPRLEKEANIKIPITYLPLDKADNFEKLVSIEDKLKDSDNELPAVVIGDKILGGKKEIDDNLKKMIMDFSQGKLTWNEVDQSNDSDGAKNAIEERFGSFGVIPIIIGGLIDGINPCAFTTIIFLLSYLFYLGKKRKEVLIAGASFSAGVFITYTLLGLGLLTLLSSLTIYSYISTGIKFVTLGMVAVFAILSLYDYILCLRGKSGEVSLQLPAFLKKKIHEKVRNQTKKPKLIIASFTLGLFVSVFELVCTGQVYLPTLVYMMNTADLLTQTLKAIFYLILYNIAFIVPLVLVFVLAYFGLTSEKLANIFKKNVALVKLLTVLLFFGLGLFIVISYL